MHDATDHELLTAFRAGDREAYAVLVARHEGLVRTACLRQAPSADVEDAIQAVFLVLARRPAAATRAPALAAWLLKVSWFVCRRAQRSAQRRRQAEREAASVQTTPTGRPEALDHLDDCLARLPEKQRVAVSLHYLAGKAPDEIASALGTSRDNAYQLISRGLAALRVLLARRGVAVGSTALISLFASEVQAATAAAATTALAASLSATPSAGATALATGAMSAMTITALTPIAATAAALLLSVGITTAVMAAETGLAPSPSGQQTAKAAAGSLERQLQQEITVDFQATSLTNAMKFFQMVTGANLTLDPSALTSQPAQTVTLTVTKMPLRHALGFVERLTGLSHTINGENYRIHALNSGTAKPTARQSPCDLSASRNWPSLQTALDQHITCSFQDEQVDKICTWLRQVTMANIVLTDAARTNRTPVTIQFADRRLADALPMIAMISGIRIIALDGALLVDADQPAPAQGNGRNNGF